ncbi:MAG: hypothetical protein ACRDY5_09390, partial [Acidimicrobiales bacterium]
MTGAAGGGRYVLLGLAQARSTWFATVAQWANCGTIPAEFIKCVSTEELRARLASGRPFSAMLVDASSPSLDRDLVETARSVGCATVVVDDRRGRHDWATLGPAGVLAEFFDPTSLTEMLAGQATMIRRGESPHPPTTPAPAPAGAGRVVTVCGSGGTGTSTVAIAVAQGLAAGGMAPVLLADLALNAEQAMLHDARDVVPGVQELVEAHRSRRPSPEDVRSLTFRIEERGYQLLLGLRRARAWSAIRPRAFEAAFGSLRSAYPAVVCDTDADLEGEEEGGSIDVEERHVMARTATREADIVMAVGLPGMKGVHALVRVLNELHSAGVEPERIVPVVNRAPRGGRARSEIAATIAALAVASGRTFGPALFLPDRRVEEDLRDGVPLPAVLVTPLAGALTATVAQVPSARRRDGGPQAVPPGSLGSWAHVEDDEDDDGPGEAAY